MLRCVRPQSLSTLLLETIYLPMFTIISHLEITHSDLFTLKTLAKESRGRS